MTRIAAAAVAVLLLFATASPAEIYRWEDEAGTVHFTDDMTNIPEAYRGKSSVVVREAPKAGDQSPAAEATQGGEPSTPAPPAEGETATASGEREELASRAEQLKSKIAAKENHVKFVEDRQNLILNPDRRRVVDPKDIQLYKKYQSELPLDRERLRELELLIESLN
jgi:hypothetical protein